MILDIQGHSVLIDEEDYGRIENINWRILNNKGKLYVKKGSRKGRVYKDIFLHRVIMNAPKGTMVDHINGNTLDNRKSNLRFCTIAENSRNRKRNQSKTGYKGIHYRKDRKKYTAQIRVNYKRHFLGYFDTAEEAYAAYCAASKKYHGEFGRIA